MKVFLKDLLGPDKALAPGSIRILVVTLPNAFAVQRGWSETREKRMRLAALSNLHPKVASGFVNVG